MGGPASTLCARPLHAVLYTASSSTILIVSATRDKKNIEIAILPFRMEQGRRSVMVAEGLLDVELSPEAAEPASAGVVEQIEDIEPFDLV